MVLILEYSCHFHSQFSNGTHDWVFNDLNIGCIKFNLNRSSVKRRTSQVYLVVWLYCCWKVISPKCHCSLSRIETSLRTKDHLGNSNGKTSLWSASEKQDMEDANLKCKQDNLSNKLLIGYLSENPQCILSWLAICLNRTSMTIMQTINMVHCSGKEALFSIYVLTIIENNPLDSFDIIAPIIFVYSMHIDNFKCLEKYF